MAYDFKRLADVEELLEVPEGAKAIIEVDGDIKRAPTGGGGNAILEDLIFDLDFSIYGSGISLENMEQVKRAYDNNMNIYAVLTTDPSGMRYAHKLSFYNIKDTMVFTENSGGQVTGFELNDASSTLKMRIDMNEYANGELIIFTSALIIRSMTGYTCVKVYASIF